MAKIKLLFNANGCPFTTAKIRELAARFDAKFVAFTAVPDKVEVSRYQQDGRRYTHWGYNPYAVFRKISGDFIFCGKSRIELFVKDCPLWNDPQVGGRIGGVYHEATHAFAYSTYRHDFYQPHNFPVAVDGGRDYVRTVGDIHAVRSAYYDIRKDAICEGYYDSSEVDFDNPTVIGYVQDGQFKKTRKE